MDRLVTNVNDEHFLEDQRKLTDESLTDERDKTDESLLILRKKTEHETDERVKSDRQVVDEARNQRRIETDNNRSIQRGFADQNRQVKTQDETLLSNERRVSDGITTIERISIDAAIGQERDLYENAVNESLRSEREETDENLLRERERTDSDALKASKLYSDEFTSHKVTKAALTTQDEFRAIVSHDLRNPIGAIQSCTSMILEDSDYADMTKDMRNWIEFIKRNAESSLRMITDILDMERIAEGKLQLQLASHNLDQMIKETIESYAHVASDKTIFLKFKPSDSATYINCDRDRIIQVVSNLVGNALKFTHEGSAVTVKICLEKDDIQVMVEDKGPGISDDQKVKIFDRFAQLHNKDRRGLGLGLYISRMLIEAHNGKLWMTSTLGLGSTFIFSLPRVSLK